MEKIFHNIIRVARMEKDMFDEALKVPELSSHAAAVILLSSLAAGIGSIGRIGIAGIILGSFGALASWIVWVGLVYFSSLVVLPGHKTKNFSLPDFLRVTGFAAAPGIIRAAGIIGPLYSILTVIAYLWMVWAISIALKETAGHKTLTESVLISAGSWVVMYFIITVLLSSRVF